MGQSINHQSRTKDHFFVTCVTSQSIIHYIEITFWT